MRITNFLDQKQQSSNAELEQWARAALLVIMEQTERMTSEQLAQWEGVRTVIESCPVEDEVTK